MTKSGVTAAAIRQRLAREQSHYKKLAGIRFTHNTRFVYLEYQYGIRQCWDALERAFRTHGTSYWCALVGKRRQVLRKSFPDCLWRSDSLEEAISAENYYCAFGSDTSTRNNSRRRQSENNSVSSQLLPNSFIHRT